MEVSTLLHGIKWWPYKVLITVIGMYGRPSKIAIIIIVIAIAIISLFPVLAHVVPAVQLKLLLVCKSKSHLAFRSQFKYPSRKPPWLSPASSPKHSPRILWHHNHIWASCVLSLSLQAPWVLHSHLTHLWSKSQPQNPATCRELVNISWTNCWTTNLHVLY